MEEPLIAMLERPVTEEDLKVLAQPRDVRAPALKRLSTRHHRLARCLAEGMSPGEAAIACDYVLSRVSILQDDPTFQHLVQTYKKQVDAHYSDLHEKLSQVAGTAASLIQDRLEEEGEDLDVEVLERLVKMGADRTGYGPQVTKNHNINTGFAARLDAARARISQFREPAVIEAEVIDSDD